MSQIAYAKLKDGNVNKWYNVWIRQGACNSLNTQPKFYVHAMYGNYQIVAPVDGAEFWEQDYGNWNSDPFDSFNAAYTVLLNKIKAKVRNGYSIIEQVTV